MSDNTKKNSNNSSILGYIIASIALVAIFLLVFITNRKIVFMMDDIWYWHNLVTDEPISSISDIIESQKWHYNNWGGRTVAHSVLQLLLWSGYLISDILNTCVLGLLVFILAKSSGKNRMVWSILLAVSLIIACNPALRDTLFWQSGCANYLYMSIIYIPFVWVYIHVINCISSNNVNASDSKYPFSSTNPFVNILLAIVLLIWGILAGWTNENIGPTITLLSISIEVILVIKKKGIKAWMISGTIGSALGSALMILAPGNKVRELEVPDYGNWKLNLCRRVVDYLKPAYEWLWPIILITIFSIMLYVIVKKQTPDIASILILSCGVVSYGALVLSPHIPERSMFGIILFLTWGSMRLLNKVFEEQKAHIWQMVITLICAFSAFMKLFYLFAITTGWYL